jgi:D-sedoheptulose 7-phosphate isomerase
MDRQVEIERIRRHLLESARIKQQLADETAATIALAARLISEAFQRQGKVLVCGNGGSAADSQHLAAELMWRLTARFDRPGLPTIALTTDTSLLTAYTNDAGVEGVFERQVLTLGNRGDLLIAISTSGRSPNIVRAAAAARDRGMSVVALTGKGSALSPLSDVAIAVPSSCTAHIQEAHITVIHILCDLVEQHLFVDAGYPECARNSQASFLGDVP